MKINIDDIIKELKPYLSDLLDCDGKGKRIEYKQMFDEIAILVYEYPFKDSSELATLIIKSLNSKLFRVYEGALFVNTCTHSFDQVYKVCKENNYTEYRFIKEDK